MKKVCDYIKIPFNFNCQLVKTTENKLEEANKIILSILNNTLSDDLLESLKKLREIEGKKK